MDAVASLLRDWAVLLLAVELKVGVVSEDVWVETGERIIEVVGSDLLLLLRL